MLPRWGKAERRARRETALFLVSPVEYAVAEGMHDGDVWCIAEDLGMTRQVVEDSRAVVSMR